jgi:hypothetical protein
MNAIEPKESLSARINEAVDFMTARWRKDNETRACCRCSSRRTVRRARFRTPLQGSLDERQPSRAEALAYPLMLPRFW